MKRRFRRLERILRELGLDDATRTHDVKARREVQAAIFVLQVKQQIEPDETVEDFDLSLQSGYFFKWYGGPYSSRLDETHSKMVSHLRYEGTKNGPVEDSEFANTLIVRNAHAIGEAIQSPPGEDPIEDPRDRSLWMRTLATTAYCLAGGWNVEETRHKVGQALGERWGNYVDDAIRLLGSEEFGVLNINDYPLREQRDPMVA